MSGALTVARVGTPAVDATTCKKDHSIVDPHDLKGCHGVRNGKLPVTSAAGIASGRGPAANIVVSRSNR